jgi:oligogalacturonide lyase
LSFCKTVAASMSTSRFISSAGCGKGRTLPPESRVQRDTQTGVAVRQVTAAACIHHHPFYYLPAYDDAMRWLVFVSHRTGTAQIHAEERATGLLVQLTDRADLNEWSLHPSHDGRFVYFTAGCGAWRVSLEDFSEELIATFDTGSIADRASMVAAGMGTTTLSRDDRWWAVPVNYGAVSRLHLFDMQTQSAAVILERDTICHPQFHPDDATLLRYGGPWQDRLWIINRDGTGNRSVHARDAAKKEWIVHETWRPGTREILAANWRRGVIGVDIDTGAVRAVCDFNAWHPMIDRTGTRMITDTRNPDRGLQLFDPRHHAAAPQLLCQSEASSVGDHWDLGHCPYDDDAARKVFAPQHTHPHPNFSPDGRFVVFTSDRTGHAQVYEVELPEHQRPAH